MAQDSRSPEQLRNHFEVERELADRLRHSTREQRTELFRTMYGELFERVPDHPRLVRREDEASTRRAVESQMSLLRGHLTGVKTFLEIAPGDCRLAFAIARHVEKVIGVDISDQSGSVRDVPGNFQLVVYDGYHLDVPEGSVDLAFSYQFMEHLHPDDVPLHFQLIRKALRPGGTYVFSTPHRFSGPHDISAHFSDTPEGFHLKEWTYGELTEVVKQAGFSRSYTYRFGKARCNAAWNALVLGAEGIVSMLPRGLQKAISRRLFEGVTMLVRR